MKGLSPRITLEWFAMKNPAIDRWAVEQENIKGLEAKRGL